jgi:ubiquinone/menaquinone biosynthesis C-methylase UbiE
MRLEARFRDRFVAHYDALMEPLERSVFAGARARLITRANGRVLDLGAGTGANFACFGHAARSVVALDPDPRMLAQARAKAGAAIPTIAIVTGTAEELPFAPGSFDSVVATLVFCTVADPCRALAEVVRVLRPGGVLLMVEHVRSSNRLLAGVQTALTPVQRIVAAGCHLDRATRMLVESGGLRVTSARQRFASIVVELEAVRP